MSDTRERLPPASPEPELADDLLRGAEEIAYFLFKNRGERRKVFHLVSTSRLPVFRLGSLICARKSVLMKFVSDQEARSLGKA